MAYRRGKRNLSRQRSDSEDDDERYEPKADDYTEHMAEKYLRDEYLRQSITKYSDHDSALFFGCDLNDSEAMWDAKGAVMADQFKDFTLKISPVSYTHLRAHET